MNLLTKATDKDFWRGVRDKRCFESYRNEVLSVWELNYADGYFEALKWSEYKLFFETGDRNTYEKKFFARRMAMNSSALLALIYPDDEKYINALMDMIYTVCDEYSWCMPAHQWQNDHADSTVIDLAASELALSLAEIYVMLGDRLDPVIRSRIVAELERRVFAPYEAQRPYLPWEMWDNNWVSVCTASIACAYMLMKPERAEGLIPRFETAMKRFLDGYLDDGVCSEGCAYWNYGFGYFVIYADMLNRFTSGRINHFESEKVKTIATFIQKMFLSGDVSVNFSDGSTTARYNAGIQHYLKSMYPEDVLVYDAKFSSAGPAGARIAFALCSAVWFNEEYAENPDSLATELRFFAKDTEWLISRNENYGFAAKAGNNQEFHNHNDIGSFIFAKDGRHILTDTGSGVYTRQYFDKELRYTHFETTSAAHSVPIFNGNLQRNGAEYRAENVSFDGDVLSFDMSGAYGIPELRALKRSFSLHERGVTLVDELDYVGDGVISERFILTCKPCETDGVLECFGVRLIPSENLGYEISEQTVRNGDIEYILDFKLAAVCKRFTLKVEV